MAMLAEKRKRVKYCLNPNGNLWNNDNNKFGQKMLEKMGWKKGQGLGSKNQGITERIKLPYKFDSKGFGFKEKDGALDQQNNFQMLLNELNNDQVKEQSRVTSLEEKSKKSKSRVHYQKFTRGKDISRYSSKDLNSILGGMNDSFANITSISCDKNAEDLMDSSENIQKADIPDVNNVSDTYTEIIDSKQCIESISLEIENVSKEEITYNDESNSNNDILGKKAKKRKICIKSSVNETTENAEFMLDSLSCQKENSGDYDCKKSQKKKRKNHSCNDKSDINNINEVKENYMIIEDLKSNNSGTHDVFENIDNSNDDNSLKISKRKSKKHRKLKTEDTEDILNNDECCKYDKVQTHKMCDNIDSFNIVNSNSNCDSETVNDVEILKCKTKHRKKPKNDDNSRIEHIFQYDKNITHSICEDTDILNLENINSNVEQETNDDLILSVCNSKKLKKVQDKANEDNSKIEINDDHLIKASINSVISKKNWKLNASPVFNAFKGSNWKSVLGYGYGNEKEVN